MDAIKTKTLDNGFTVKIYYDPDPESPRKWDNLGTVTLVNGRYNFGDATASSAEMQRISNDPENIVLPVYIYDHSGITINTTGFSCPWDSGIVGFIHCSKERARKEYSTNRITKQVREKVLRVFRGEIETLDQYLTGQIYGYTVEDAEGNDVSSCWGFYGMNYCMDEALADARAHEVTA